MSVTAGSEHTITGAGDGGRGSHVFIRWSKRRVGDGRLERRMRLVVAYRQSVPSYCPRSLLGVLLADAVSDAEVSPHTRHAQPLGSPRFLFSEESPQLCPSLRTPFFFRVRTWAERSPALAREFATLPWEPRTKLANSSTSRRDGLRKTLEPNCLSQNCYGLRSMIMMMIDTIKIPVQ